jgi:amidase
MGHKPSYGIVPGHGQIPPMPGAFTQSDINVVGPMARSIGDLELSLDLLAGPDRWNTPAWRLDLPPARATTLGELRIAAWLDDPYCAVDASTRRLFEDTVGAIEGAGGRVDTESRPGFSLELVDTVFNRLLCAALAGSHAPEKIERMAANTDDTPLGFCKRATGMRHRDWLADNERRQQIREQWRVFFERFDVILLPVEPRAAFPHDHTEPMMGRMVEVDGAQRTYLNLTSWIGPAGAAYLPATVVPVGLGNDGLPIGIQVVGPYLHDKTTLQAGRLIARLRGGCPRPALAL